MPIPDIPDFSKLLASLSLRSPNDATDLSAIEIVPRSYRGDGVTLSEDGPIYLAYDSRGPLSIEALLRRIETELNNLKHKPDRPLAQAVLGIYCLDPSRERDPVNHLNNPLRTMVEANVTQLCVFSASPPTGFSRFEFGASGNFGKLRETGQN
jgi:hypothetical protein